jgi:hypothetical protein
MNDRARLEMQIFLVFRKLGLLRMRLARTHARLARLYLDEARQALDTSADAARRMGAIMTSSGPVDPMGKHVLAILDEDRLSSTPVNPTGSFVTASSPRLAPRRWRGELSSSSANSPAHRSPTPHR